MKIIKDNPMEGVKKLSIQRKEIQCYRSNDLGDSIEALNRDPLMWKIYCLGALFRGFRRGELTALEWSNIHF